MKGPTFAPVAYLSKKLDPTVQGWAPCLRALAAAYVLIQEAKKLTFGGMITIISPHHLKDLLTYKGLKTLLPCQIILLLVSFLHDSSITFQACSSLNPATLFPVMQDLPFYHCIETLKDLLPCLSHIKEGLLENLTHVWFTDGSSFLMNREQQAGYAIVSLTETIEAKSLPQNTTNQLAELFAVKHASELAADCSLTLYTDSTYAFHILSHLSIWKERGLLTTKGTSITNSKPITDLLHASLLPSEIGIIHFCSHQSDSSPITIGNSKANSNRLQDRQLCQKTQPLL